jgi:hypothetical protein
VVTARRAAGTSYAVIRAGSRDGTPATGTNATRSPASSAKKSVGNSAPSAPERAAPPARTARCSSWKASIHQATTSDPATWSVIARVVSMGSSR